MANPTTNYGFVLPTSTDLVTDLPADFDVALQGVDTRLKALQPGTTLGDIAYSSATANTNTRLGVGSTGQVLTGAAGVPSWATPSTTSPSSYSLINTGGTALTGATTITISGISGMSKLYLFIDGASTTIQGPNYGVRLNTDTSALYQYGGVLFKGTASYAKTFAAPVSATAGTYFYVGSGASTDISTMTAGVWIDGANNTGHKFISSTSGIDQATSNNGESVVAQGLYRGTSVVTSVSLFSSSGNFDAGTIYVYGSAN